MSSQDPAIDSVRTQSAPMHLWRGRVDAHEGALGLRWHQLMQAWDGEPAEERGLCLLGFASDEGVRRNQGRIGAAAGPDAIRRALANLPAHQCRKLYDAGSIACPTGSEFPNSLETAQKTYADRLAQVLDSGHFPLVLGGGHEIAYGSFTGLAQHLTQQAQDKAPRIGIINFDAHFDLRRDAQPSSGTPFLQIAEQCAQRQWPFHYFCLGVSEFANTPALFQRAESHQVQWTMDRDTIWPQVANVEHQLEHFINQVDYLYLTICLDVFPAAYAPGVSAPSAFGVEVSLVEHLIQAIASSGKLRLADIAEMSPGFDQDQRTARLAARLGAGIANIVASQ